MRCNRAFASSVMAVLEELGYAVTFTKVHYDDVTGR